MKNLELLYAQIQDRGMSGETYTELCGDVLHNQKLFTLDEHGKNCGVLLKSDDGSLHIWFITRSQDNSLFYVTETGTWYANQLGQAMDDLMTEMKLRSL